MEQAFGEVNGKPRFFSRRPCPGRDRWPRDRAASFILRSAAPAYSLGSRAYRQRRTAMDLDRRGGGTGRVMKRKIAAILAADVEGYSRLVSEDEEDALRRLALYREVFADFVAKAGGRIFNTAGDAVLAEFSSAVEAMRCAIDVQESLRTRNLGYPPTRQMRFRIGITIGDVVEREGDLLGDGVNIAARLQGLAAPGGICVSRSVHEQVVGKISMPFRDIGEQQVKNIAQRIHAFAVAPDGDGAGRLGGGARGRAASPSVRGSGTTLALSAAATAFGIASLGIVLMTAAPWREHPAASRTQHVSQAHPAVPATATPAEAFTILARMGGIIVEPATVPEWYHNARNHEARGDPDAARRDYAELIALGTNTIDPLLRYAFLLRSKGGRAAAREQFAALAAKGGLGSRLVFALQFDDRERRKRLEEFVAANPNFGPGHFLLAREFSPEKVGEQTLYDKRREFEALDRFLALDRQGKLEAYFMDASMLAEWLERAHRSHVLLDAFLQTAAVAPVARFVRTSTGWSVALLLPEASPRVEYRLKPGDAFRSTGALAEVDPRSGKPAPKTSFDLPADLRQAVIEVNYEDMGGRTQGPFKIRFDAFRALVKDQQETLDRFPAAWVTYRTGAGKDVLFDYTQLVNCRCAIAKAEFGFDEAPPSRALPLPRCDAADPGAAPPAAAATFPLPGGTRAVSVQLTYADGSRSETRVFPRP